MNYELDLPREIGSIAPEVVVLMSPVVCASPQHTRKFKGAKTQLWRVLSENKAIVKVGNNEPEPEYREADVDEDRVKEIVAGDLEISLLKAFRPLIAILFREAREKIPDATIPELFQILGWPFFSYANDVVSTISIGEKVILEYKEKETWTKDDVFAHLRRTIGEEREGSPYINVQWRSSYSLYEAVTDIGVVLQNIHDLVLYQASDDFLNALIYGLYDPLHKVDLQTQKRFLRLYEKGTAYSTPNHPDKPHRHGNNWAGWTPEHGMPLRNLLRVNGARPGDTIPFIELLVASIDGLRPTQDGFDKAASDAIKDVRGKRGELRKLVDLLVRKVASFPTVRDLNAWKGDEEFVQLAGTLRESGAGAEHPLPETMYTGRTFLVSEDGVPVDEEVLHTLIMTLLRLTSTSPIQ